MIGTALQYAFNWNGLSFSKMFDVSKHYVFLIKIVEAKSFPYLFYQFFSYDDTMFPCQGFFITYIRILQLLHNYCIALDIHAIILIFVKRTI